jgi:hypothetical protein
MKTKIFFVLMLCIPSYAQGTVHFNNRGLRSPEGFYDAPVSLPNGSLAAGPEFTAGLFLLQGDSLNLVTTSPFRTGAAAGFFLLQDVIVPGVPAGSPATFRVRVWETAAQSYDNAALSGALHGEFPTSDPNNNVFVPRLASPNFPENIPTLDGIQPFTLIPEPSPISIVTAAAILYLSFSRERRVLKRNN